MSAVVQPVKVEIPGMVMELKPVTVHGDNPRFFAQQVEVQMRNVAHKARLAIEALYGEQAL